MNEIDELIDRLVGAAMQYSARQSFAKDEYYQYLQDAKDALRARVALMESALERLRAKHYECDEDCWYSCPKSGECCNHDLPDDKCNCGADQINAIIDEALKGGDK